MFIITKVAMDRSVFFVAILIKKNISVAVSILVSLENHSNILVEIS